MLKEGERKENDRKKEDHFLLQAGMPVIHVSSTGEKVETVSLFQNDVETQLLREFKTYAQKRKDAGYADGTIISIGKMDLYEVTGLNCLVEVKASRTSKASV